ncbi:MAG: LptF/LptG family permease [Deferribacterales bacterium]
MISKFDKYIISLFLKYTIVVQIVVGVISLLASAAMHTDLIDKYKVGIVEVLIFDMMKIPYLLYTTMPMSIVISTMLVILTLIKNNELMAYVSLGGKIRNLIQPFLISGVVVALLLVLTANTINPKVMYMREKYAAEIIYKKEMDIRPSLTNIWMKLHGNKFIHITALDPDKMEFHYVTEYTLNDKLQVESIETYNSAKKDGDKWKLFNQKKYDMMNVPKKTYDVRNITMTKPIFDELSKMPFLKPQFVSIGDIYKVAEVMKNQNVNTSKYMLQIYKIFAHAISVLVIILVIFPLCVDFNRNHSYIKAAAKSLGVGFAFWMSVASCSSLGKNGVLSPFMSSFLPIILFACLAVYIIYRREHAM